MIGCPPIIVGSPSTAVASPKIALSSGSTSDSNSCSTARNLSNRQGQAVRSWSPLHLNCLLLLQKRIRPIASSLPTTNSPTLPLLRTLSRKCMLLHLCSSRLNSTKHSFGNHLLESNTTSLFHGSPTSQAILPHTFRSYKKQRC